MAWLLSVVPDRASGIHLDGAGGSISTQKKFNFHLLFKWQSLAAFL